MNTVFALIHSPLVGPTTWQPVAQALCGLGRGAVVPTLHDDDDNSDPYWKQEVESVVSTLQRPGQGGRLILVGHSGAGALLPAIGQRMVNQVAGYIYVDAGLPLDGASRLDEMTKSSPEFAAELRVQLTTGSRAPRWSDDDLRPFIPDDDLRHRVVSELTPRPLAYFEEPIPSPRNWEHASSGYILFSSTYAPAAQRARALGWPCLEIQGGHFHMLVDPGAVATALVEIAKMF